MRGFCVYRGKQKIAATKPRLLLCMVETTGFEPATSCSRSKRSTKLSHVSKMELFRCRPVIVISIIRSKQ